MAQFRLISADSHVMEPANFWVEHVDKKFKDQAPRVVAKPDGQGLVFTGPGLSPFPVAGGFGTGRSGEELKEHMKKGYEAARPAAGIRPSASRIRTSTASRPRCSTPRSGCRSSR